MDSLAAKFVPSSPSRIRAVRLPTRIHLPFGYTVLVKQITDAEMILHDEDGELQDGLWDVELRTIFVRRSLPLTRRKYILGHEILHAVNDWVHDCLNEEAMKP